MVFESIENFAEELMADITMCVESNCPFSKKCKRHPDSGTYVGQFQSWGMFEKKINKKQKPEDCSGWLPISKNK